MQRHAIKRRNITQNTLPFSTIANRYIEVQEGRGNSPETIKHYQQSIKKLKLFLCWLTDKTNAYPHLTNTEREHIGGSQSIALFQRADIESQFRRFLFDVEEVSDVTVCTYFRDYRAIAYWMMKNHFIASHEIIIRQVETDIKEVYSDEEISRLLKKPKNNCTFAEYRDWVVIHHLLATGNRISTVCAIKIKDIDWIDGMLMVQSQKNKHKTRIPLESTYLEVLREYIDTWLLDDKGNYICEYLFPSSFVSSTEPMNRISLARSIAEYNNRRHVKKTSTHLFRHTFAKYWILSGKDLHSLQRMLGHSTLEMVTHYANLYDIDLKPKVEEHSILKDQKAKKRNTGKMMSRQRYK